MNERPLSWRVRRSSSQDDDEGSEPSLIKWFAQHGRSLFPHSRLVEPKLPQDYFLPSFLCRPIGFQFSRQLGPCCRTHFLFRLSGRVAEFFHRFSSSQVFPSCLLSRGNLPLDSRAHSSAFAWYGAGIGRAAELRQRPLQSRPSARFCW